MSVSFMSGPMDHHLRAPPSSDESRSPAKRHAARRNASKTSIAGNIIRMVKSRQGMSDAASATANLKRDHPASSSKRSSQNSLGGEMSVDGLKRAVSFAPGAGKLEQEEEKGTDRLLRKVMGKLGFGDDEKKTETPTTRQGAGAPSPKYPKFERGEVEPYQRADKDPLCPVTPNGHLREAYVRELVKRVNEPANRDEGWTRACLGRWFGRHLQLQIRSGEIPRDYVAHFLAAVDLHRRMSTHPGVPRPEDEKRLDPDLLWVEVVDAMYSGMKMKHPIIMHTAGTETVGLDEFVACFAEVVRRAGWNENMRIRQFPDVAAAIEKSSSWRKRQQETAEGSD